MTDPLLYHRSVSGALTRDFLLGGSAPDLSAFRQDADLDCLDGENRSQVDVDLIEGIVAHALDLGLSGTELDAWLSPRIHNSLRVPRFLAADHGFWAWLAIDHFHAYVRARWAPGGADEVSAWRYTGDLLRNAVSRLWWGAEMVRNGPSYDYVGPLFKRVRTAQWALELKYSWYRPAPIAFVRVAEAVHTGKELTDDEMRTLSKRINAYLSLTALEAVGVDDQHNQAYDEEWRRHTPSLAEVVDGSNLVGPTDGAVPDEAIDSLEAWFRKLAGSPLD